MHPRSADETRPSRIPYVAGASNPALTLPADARRRGAATADAGTVAADNTGPRSAHAASANSAAVAPLATHLFAVAIVALLVFLVTGAPAQALTVAITDPTEGETVSGSVTILGTSDVVPPGRVAVSIDGGAFNEASGTDPWTYVWDASSTSPGAHAIVARARQQIQGPAVFDTVNVTVSAPGLSVQIVSPLEGSTIIGTFVVTGTSSGATAVSLQIDAGPFYPANGVDPWDYVIEDGLLSPGPHSVTARAEDGFGGFAFDTVAFLAGDSSPGTQAVTYTSSVDGEAMILKLYLPTGFDPAGPPVPLVCHLHGGGGLGVISPDMQSELDDRGWIGIAPDGRAWGLAAAGCSWGTSAAYVDNPDPNVGPGERDILDAIDWAAANFPVDPDRVYLTGFSMGGRGTYIIGLRNPDRFAAIAPTAPASDMFEIYTRRPDPCICKEGMVGGKPGDSPFVDTMYKITSGRFLLENAYNLPVFHAHGTIDRVATNDKSDPNAPYWHGWHMTLDYWDGTVTTPDTNGGISGWGNDCFVGPDSLLPFTFNFGHTPNLTDLRAAFPAAYDWAFMFTPVDHTPDPKWIHGTAMAPGDLGVEDPENPGTLLGIYEFFSRHTRIASPSTVVFKTFTDTHRSAYWATIDIDQPWQDRPGAIRAVRDSVANQLSLELAHVRQVEIDLPRAQLAFGPGITLIVPIAPLDQPAFDPALAVPGEPLAPTLVLHGAFDGLTQVAATLDGVPVDPGLLVWTEEQLTVGPLDVGSGGTLVLIGNPSTTGVGEAGAPTRFAMELASGNPVSRRAAEKIAFRVELPVDTSVRIDLFDVAGRLRASLLEDHLIAGQHLLLLPREAWSRIASGVYLVRMSAQQFSATRRLVVLP